VAGADTIEIDLDHVTIDRATIDLDRAARARGQAVYGLGLNNQGSGFRV
jgi:hypothetical protein